MKEFEEGAFDRSGKPLTVEEVLNGNQATTGQAPASEQASTGTQPAKEEGEGPFLKQGNRTDGEGPLVTKFNG
jgi:hypothetical protein